MIRQRRRLIAAAAGLAALAVVLLFSRDRPPAEERPVHRSLPLPTSAPPPVAASAPPTDAGAVPAQKAEPGRIDLERPPPRAPTDAPPRPAAQLAAAALGPVDRRENPGPHAKQELEILHYAFETLEDDVRECLQQWDAVQPGQAREVMVAFELDANGLQRSWLEHEGEIPFGPRTCLANAVYGLDWSKIVDHPAKVTQRFELGRPDARR